MTWLCGKQMMGDFTRYYVIFFPVCKDAGLNVKLDLPDVMKVSRKTNDMQRESLVKVK
jgi:hypothetical protein